MHEFEAISIPYYIDKIYEILNRDRKTACQMCKKCNLIIYTIDNSYSRFYINNTEIFKMYTDINQIQLTCEEFLIKSIIE